MHFALCFGQRVNPGMPSVKPRFPWTRPNLSATTPHAGGPSCITRSRRLDASSHGDLRVGIAGFGAIGRSLAQTLLGRVPGLRLSAVSSRDLPAIRDMLPGDVAVVPVEALPQHAEIIVECAPASALPSIARPDGVDVVE